MVFFGSEKGKADCEVIAFSVIPAEKRLCESELFRSKWFDYRTMHPVLATYLFAHLYRDAIALWHYEIMGQESAERVRAFSNADPLAGRDALPLWNARQSFDRIGVRYDWGLRWVMNRFTERGWMTHPRLDQLVNEELLLDLADAWRNWCAVSMQYPGSEGLQCLTDGKLTMVQKAWETWCLAQIKSRTSPGNEWRALGSLLSRQLVTETSARAVFDASTVASAVRFSSQM